MSQPSQWPLSSDATRSILPKFIVNELAHSAISKDCYPIAMGYYPKAQGHFIQRQQHDDNLLLYCTSGSGHIHTEYFDGQINAGDILLIPAGLSHQYYADHKQPWTIYWLHFSGDSCPRLLQNLGYKHEQPVTHLGMQPQLIADFKRLLDAHQTGYRRAAYNHAASVVRLILCYLALEITNSQALQRHNFSLDAIHSFMQERINGDLNLDTLAASFNLSKYHFSSKYKQLTGYPPIKHFIHMKMERACYLLDASQSSIKVISNQLGYEDPLYFSRLFRKTIGVSPTAYRQHEQG
jgi:AraC family transcriptional regulator, arabinose operon regulatory protein